MGEVRCVVITGGTRGIGLAMAKVFLKNGCHVTLSGTSDTSLDHARTDLTGFGDRVRYVICDVRNMADVENLWDEAHAAWGRVDIWINNAGRNGPHAFLYNTSLKNVDDVIDTNIKGMIYGSQVAAKHMLKQGHGQIWCMEGLGSNNMVQAKAVLYGTSKHALTYFTRGLAKELKGTGVMAGRLSPGMMLTEFITKPVEGSDSKVLEDPRFIRIFNILADKPETVADYLVPRMLGNTRNNAHIVWLTGLKTLYRFTIGQIRKRKIIEGETE